MKIVISSCILFIVILSQSQAGIEPLAFANLKITGNILSESCNVETSSADVHIGDFPQYMFSTVGDVSPAKEFDIQLTGCSEGITGGVIMFSGNPDSTNTALLALSDTSGSSIMAVGVAIEIIDSKGVPVALNTNSIKQPLYPGDNTMHFQLRYKSTMNPVKAGDASSIMYFDISYQ